VQFGGLSVECDDVVDIEARGEGASRGGVGAAWTTEGWLRMRHCAAAI
jgi:hypothetical protein